MSIDRIADLPIDKNYTPQTGDLEFMYRLFQPKNTTAIKNVAGGFQLAFIAALLFGLLSTDFAYKLVESYSKSSTVVNKIILMLVFMIVLYLLQKFYLKM